MIEVLEKSWNFQSSIGNTVRDYFKDTVTPHFFNVAIFLKLDTLPLPLHCFCIIKWFDPASTPPKNPQQSTLPVKLRMCPA